MTESSFPLLHPAVQRWVYLKGWTDLHPVQNAAIPVVLPADRDVLIGASTAAGKTEAAFLPICSSLVAEPGGGGVDVLYLSPLKALINDQFRRVEGLCESLDVPVHRWHGDVAGSRKAALLKAPNGILLTTPESLEGMFVLRGTKMAKLFAALRFVVVDELHSFIGSDRGVQLVSLLHRLDTTIRRQVPRVGLSATFGDMSLAARQLRPGDSYPLALVNAPGDGGQEIRVQVRAYTDGRPDPGGAIISPAKKQIAAHLHARLRGGTNLAFANSRSAVEEYSVELARLSEKAGLPNEFHPHHGNLAKELREDVEAMLRDITRPTTAVCTTTLEMGIDIGEIAQVAQLGPPSTVASLRQRLGRSGRRAGQPAILRAYVEEREPDSRTPLVDRLHPDLVQTCAVIDLLFESWCEPPEPGAVHLSTLVQQLLSTIAQYGGVSASQAYRVLCGRGGPFHEVPTSAFLQLLRDLGEHEVITQIADGTLLLGDRGEQTVNHYTFYAAFHSPEEYRLVAHGQTLGTMPVDFPIFPDMPLTFAGRRWRVLGLHDTEKIIELAPSRAGNAVLSGTGGYRVHTRVRRRMRDILGGDGDPAYSDPAALRLLDLARRTYERSGLARAGVVQDGADAFILPWVGDRQLATLAAMLRADGMQADAGRVAITVPGTRVDTVLDLLHRVAAADVDALGLASTVLEPKLGKYDDWLGPELLIAQYAARMLDIPGARAAALAVLNGPDRQVGHQAEDQVRTIE
ncbi:DEAD/DEAH box helicase [Actinokineospora enzanensis]|uniref:DEAD/DEAH box helicase n=1 Tax=Actinokineospora enzanensis TaxID=155975 RepID=UPI00036945AB|nr:DEAD/DEAH box helicase [Actinokineospora enzanensis]